VLSGEKAAIVIEGTQGRLLSPEGIEIGSVRKVRRESRTLGALCPPDGRMLFDGISTDAFQSAKVTEDGLLLAGALTKEEVGDFRLHLEFCTPFMPHARGQSRGNSGVYIQQRYEVQILDSFGLDGVENECAGLYKRQAPLVNMCLPPLAWQTYEIYFRQARWDAEGNKTSPAFITVYHNGVLVQDCYAIPDKTGAGKPETPELGRIMFQDHNDPVRFRNIWIAPFPDPSPSAAMPPMPLALRP
jgi:hypothetical protein